MNRKILIAADDDDALRRVLELQFLEAGFPDRRGGARAMEFFPGAAVDCVIADWRMPQLSGSGFVQRASAIRNETSIVVRRRH